MGHRFRTWFLGITTLAALLALAVSTYAWFTSNQEVSTSTATARTGDETLELQISTEGGSSFQSRETVPIRQVNGTEKDRLMPVSTADLKEFVYAPFTDAGMAESFQPVQDEAYYYHGRLYLRAAGEGWKSGSRMNLYLDQTDGVLGKDADGTLLNAARLGLIFGGNSKNAVILKLSDTENVQSRQTYNTVLDGKVLGKDQVIRSKNGVLSAVADPAEPLKAYTVSFTDTDMQLPAKPLLEMELNRIYQVDVYFYLEGCDPDCSDSISFQAADLYLAFYGVLSQEGR